MDFINNSILLSVSILLCYIYHIFLFLSTQIIRQIFFNILKYSYF